MHDPAGLSPALREKFPHLANLAAFKLPPDAVAAAAQSLKGQLAVGAVRAGQGVDATRCRYPAFSMICIPPKPVRSRSDPSFRHGQTTLRVWAPTARNLKLRLFADSNTGQLHDLPDDARFRERHLELHRAGGSLHGKFYLYEAEVFVRSTNKVETNVVTDPYSVSLARNSTRSQIVSLDDPALQPRGWQ